MKVTLNMRNPGEDGLITNLAPDDAGIDNWQIMAMSGHEDLGVAVIVVVDPIMRISLEKFKESFAASIEQIVINVGRLVYNLDGGAKKINEDHNADS